MHVSIRAVYLLLRSFWRILFEAADCDCFSNNAEWTCFKIAPFTLTYTSELLKPFIYALLVGKTIKGAASFAMIYKGHNHESVSHYWCQFAVL